METARGGRRGDSLSPAMTAGRVDGLDEVRLRKVRLRKVRFGEVCPAEVRPYGVRPGKFAQGGSL
jgi:hypothetical protein